MTDVNKLKCLGYSLLPVVMWQIIQVLVSVGTAVGAGFLYGILRGAGMQEGAGEFLRSNYNYIVFVLIDAIVLIPGGFWLQKLKRQQKKETEKAVFTGKAWIRIAAFGVSMQLLVDILLMLAYALTPQIMESYTNVMENLGVFTPTVLSVLYTAILAPMAEELLFRGLTLKILEREFPFWAANMLQAFCFAVIHGNPVQGIYAFILGCLLGLLVRKYKTLRAGIFCHFIINVSGLFLGNLKFEISSMLLGAGVLMCVIFLFREKR